YMGTDLDLFPKLFKKFKIVEGAAVPTGARGMLIAHRVREDYLKNVPARLLDKLLQRVATQGLTIAHDPESKRLASELTRQHMEILVHLDRREAAALQPKLASFLKQ